MHNFKGLQLCFTSKCRGNIPVPVRLACPTKASHKMERAEQWNYLIAHPAWCLSHQAILQKQQWMEILTILPSITWDPSLWGHCLLMQVLEGQIQARSYRAGRIQAPEQVVFWLPFSYHVFFSSPFSLQDHTKPWISQRRADLLDS